MNWLIIITLLLFVAVVCFGLGWLQGYLHCYCDVMDILKSIEHKLKDNRIKTEVIK
jgi:hypothetical protein